MPSWTHVARPVFYNLTDVLILFHYSEICLPPLNEYPSSALTPTSDHSIMRRGPQPIKLPLGDNMFVNVCVLFFFFHIYILYGVLLDRLTKSSR
jgi:hypothetical protein